MDEVSWEWFKYGCFWGKADWHLMNHWNPYLVSFCASFFCYSILSDLTNHVMFILFFFCPLFFFNFHYEHSAFFPCSCRVCIQWCWCVFKITYQVHFCTCRCLWIFARLVWILDSEKAIFLTFHLCMSFLRWYPDHSGAHMAVSLPCVFIQHCLMYVGKKNPSPQSSRDANCWIHIM